MTINEAISDIELRLGQVSNDAKIPRKQIKHWLNIVRADLLKDELTSGDIDPSLLTPFYCQPVTRKLSDCDDCEERFVVALPAKPMSVTGDLGVYSIQRPGGKLIPRLESQGMASLLTNSPWNEGGWYRVGDEIEFEKVKIPSSIKLTLKLIVADISSIDESKSLPIPSHLESDLLNAVELIGRRELGVPIDPLANGKDEK